MKLRLREMREARGWTQVHVAELAGLSQGYYNELESGKKQVNARRLQKFADIYGVYPQDLILTPEVPSHAAIVAKLSRLSDEGRATLEAMIDHMVDTEAK